MLVTPLQVLCGLEARMEDSQLNKNVDLQSSMQGANPSRVYVEQTVKLLGGQE